MKTIKTFESYKPKKVNEAFLAGVNDDYAISEEELRTEVETETAKEWWDSLDKEERAEIESIQKSLGITDSNIKRFYKIYNR